MTPLSSHLNPVVRRLVQDAGNLTQALGFGRALGQVYAYLYFSQTHRNLADMQAALGISKGSASMIVRQLEQWGAVKKVWVKGDRKDYYEADQWFGNILKHMVHDTVGKRLETSSKLLDEMELEVDTTPTDTEARFIKERIRRVRKFQEKIKGLWEQPLVQLLLK